MGGHAKVERTHLSKALKILKITIHTDRLTLREFREADTEAVFGIGSQAEVVRFERFEAMTLEDAAAWVSTAMERGGDLPRVIFDLAVCLASDDRLIGWVGWAVTEGTVSVWYIVDPSHQKRGYATEAARALIGYLSSLDHKLFLIECDARNTASSRVAEKLGFELHSERPDALTIQGEQVTSLLWWKHVKPARARGWIASLLDRWW